MGGREWTPGLVLMELMKITLKGGMNFKPWSRENALQNKREEDGPGGKVLSMETEPEEGDRV